MNRLINNITLVCSLVLSGYQTIAQVVPKQVVKEEDYYRIVTIPVPEDMLVEVGGLTTLPDGRVAFCTRRGDVWIMENPYMEGNTMPAFKLFASGLHEPLGLAYKDHALYAAQRGELTRMEDTDGDDKADVFKTIYAWPLSGHYHEYSYGPKFAPDGSMFVTGNVAFGDEEWWRGESKVFGRGWTMHITPDGIMEPWATGHRSPCGLGMIDGELFYADNQGDWFGSGGIWHVNKGAFMGHPAGLRWTGTRGSPVHLTNEQFHAKIFDKRELVNGHYQKPENDTSEKHPQFLYNAKKEFPELQLPSVWLPHGILGISNSEILRDETAGKFGPFAGQVFIGDQGQSKIMRVDMEKVNGEFQGVAFDFAAGFQSGVLRMSFGHDGSLMVGETNRGWGSAGSANSGLQRLVWTGKMPMEMKTVRSMPDGFEITFTQPVDRDIAEDPDFYSGKSFIYKYHSTYGSPLVNVEPLNIAGIKVSDDGLKVRLLISNLRQYYLHQVTLNGFRSENGTPLLHPDFYYTLNNIPQGEVLGLSAPGVIRAVPPVKKPAATDTPLKSKTSAPKKPTKPATEAEIMPLLVKNTCIACHQTARRQVGPAFRDIAKRKYSNDKIVQLIYNPQPKNWPGYSTEMAPMTQVPKEEALKIAAWINSLRTAD